MCVSLQLPGVFLQASEGRQFATLAACLRELAHVPSSYELAVLSQSIRYHGSCLAVHWNIQTVDSMPCSTFQSCQVLGDCCKHVHLHQWLSEVLKAIDGGPIL